jgi:hypothetical protein
VSPVDKLVVLPPAAPPPAPVPTPESLLIPVPVPVPVPVPDEVVGRHSSEQASSMLALVPVMLLVVLSPLQPAAASAATARAETDILRI